jgi:hypothetical protein
LRDAPSTADCRAAVADGRAGEGLRSNRHGGLPENHPNLKIQYCESPQEAAEEADALVLVTEWKQFAGLDLADLAKRMAHAILVDGRNLFDPEVARRAGFDYTGIGRPQRAGARTPAEIARLLFSMRRGDRNARADRVRPGARSGRGPGGGKP